MYKILLVTTREQKFEDFIRALAAPSDISLQVVSSPDEMFDLIRTEQPHLVILDENLPDPLAMVVRILAIDAMVNTTMITSMDAEAWHEKSEGLGMMHPLPESPTPADAESLLDALRSMPGLR